MKIFWASLVFGSYLVTANELRSDDLAQRVMIRGSPNDAPGNGGVDVQEMFPVDISSYSLRFEKCQAVKTSGSSSSSEEQRSATIERYAVFRLCPNHECATCDKHYGEYLLELGHYLSILSKYFHETKGALCSTCEDCDRDPNVKEIAEARLQDFGTSCDKCGDECRMLNNMEANGYIDATDFLRCSMVYDSFDDDGKRYYAGPVCSEQGKGVTIGVFTDEDCERIDSSKSIREFLQTDEGMHMNLANSFLKMTYRETCLSCEEDNVEGFHALKSDKEDADTVKDFCEKIYDKSGKCEVNHGFNKRHGTVDSSEKETCELIEQINAGRTSSDYTEEIVDPEIAEVDTKTMFDQQSMILVVVGVGLALVVIAMKALCSTGKSRRVGVADEFDSDYHDGVSPTKALTEMEGIDMTETSNSSYDEDQELAE